MLVNNPKHPLQVKKSAKVKIFYKGIIHSIYINTNKNMELVASVFMH